MSGWEYRSVVADAWMPLEGQGGPKDLLRRLGEEGWEAFAITPPTPPLEDGPRDAGSTYEILLKRPLF